MLDIRSGFGGVERFEPRHNGNALSQLGHLRRSELGGELRLAGENDVHQLLARRLKVGQHAHDFQQRLIQILRFVDYHHDALALARLAHQAFVEFGLHARQILAVVLHAQIGEQIVQKILGRILRLK